MATTVEHVFQECQHHFPTLSFTMFLSKLNRAIQAFIQETDSVSVKILGQVSPTSVDIEITSPAAQTLTNQGTGNQLIFNIPTYCYAVHEIRFANTNGVYLDSPCNYIISNDRLEFFDNEGDPLTQWPANIAYIEFLATKAPADLAALTDSLSVPSQFVDAIVARILMDLYAKEDKLNNAGWWRGEYLRLRVEAKRFGNTQRDKTSARGYVGELLARDSNTDDYSSNTEETNLDGGIF